MDPLTAFALAPSVIQVVDFGLRAVTTANELIKNGSTEKNDQLGNISREIVGASASLQKSMRAANAPTCLDADDQALYDLSKKCLDTAEQLNAELDKLTVTDIGARKILQATKKTLAGSWKAGKHKDLKTLLESYRKTLDTRILLALRYVRSHSDIASLVLSVWQ